MPDTQAQQTFLFADLAGFSALTEAHGDEPAADLAQAFSCEVRDLLPDYGAQEIKSLGDGMMIRASDPAPAISLAARIVWDVAGRNGLPLARAGVHTGPAAERGGDWYGAAVNVAARLCEIAAPDVVLLSDATRQSAGDGGELSLEGRGDVLLRNLSVPVKVHRLRPPGAARQPPVDPVCRMVVEPGRKVAVGAHGGDIYAFCSVGCAAAFARAPDRYAVEAARP
jgi:adenylate cyclase